MKTKVEATINIHFDNCCGEPMTLTHPEAIELYHQLGSTLNYPVKTLFDAYKAPEWPSGTVLGDVVTNTVSGTTVK